MSPKCNWEFTKSNGNFTNHDGLIKKHVTGNHVAFHRECNIVDLSELGSHQAKLGWDVSDLGMLAKSLNPLKMSYGSESESYQATQTFQDSTTLKVMAIQTVG